MSETIEQLRHDLKFAEKRVKDIKEKLGISQQKIDEEIERNRPINTEKTREKIYNSLLLHKVKCGADIGL